MPQRGVSTRLSTVMLSMAAFQYSLDRELHHREMEAVGVLSGLASLALIVSASAQQNVGAPSLVDALSLFLIGASLAPVFGTLTSSYAGNTVEIMTNFAYLVHLYSMDNRIEIAHAWASPVSLNAAFASTLLQASRLRSSALSFTFTILCTSLLVFVPAADLPPQVDFILAALACLCSFIWFGLRRAILFIAIFVFAAILGPRMLNKITSVKMNGPWDLLHVPEEEEFQ
jgi:hypothetical protein